MKYYILSRLNEKYQYGRNIQYKTGLNSSEKLCNSTNLDTSGIHFYDEKNIFKALVYGDHWIREVTIPEGEVVYNYEYCGKYTTFVANNLVFSERKFLFSLDLYKELIDNGAEINPFVLEHALYGNQLKIAKYLIDEIGIPLEQKNMKEPFHHACRRGNFKMVKFLVENGVDIHSVDDVAVTLCTGYPEIVKYLIDCGADLCSRGEELLTEFAAEDNFEMVDYLLNLGVKIGINAIRFSAQNDKLNMVKYLLENYGSTISSEKELSYIFINIVRGGAINVLNYLQPIYNFDFHENNDWALAESILYGHYKIMKYLLDYGCDLRKIEKRTFQILYSKANEHKDIVEHLIEMGVPFPEGDEISDWRNNPEYLDFSIEMEMF